MPRTCRAEFPRVAIYTLTRVRVHAVYACGSVLTRRKYTLVNV